MQSSLRTTLAHSHVAAMAIAMLLVSSLDEVLVGLWEPASRAVVFVATAVAIRDLPYISPKLTSFDRMMLLVVFYRLSNALIAVTAAWLLSRWVYGTGPLRSLANHQVALSRKTNA